MAVARTCDAEWRRRSRSVICARSSRVFRSSDMEFRDSSTSLGMTKGIKHEAYERHEEFARAMGRNRLSHNCNLAVIAVLSIAAGSLNSGYESCGAVSSRK